MLETGRTARFAREAAVLPGWEEMMRDGEVPGLGSESSDLLRPWAGRRRITRKRLLN
jgi:hypothetical protein